MDYPVTYENTDPDTLQRLLEAKNFLNEPLEILLRLDDTYHSCMAELIKCHHASTKTPMSLSEMNAICDTVENHISLAKQLCICKNQILTEEFRTLSRTSDMANNVEHAYTEESLIECDTEQNIVSAAENRKRNYAEQSYDIGDSCEHLKCCCCKKPRLTKSSNHEIFEPSHMPQSSGCSTSKDQSMEGKLVIDEESTYCLCQKISYGDMVCCDNQQCQIQWFHFDCMKLKRKPKGKWFCPICRGDRSSIINPNVVTSE